MSEIADNIKTFRFINNQTHLCTVINDMHHRTIYADAMFLDVMNITMEALRYLPASALWKQNEVQKQKWRLSTEMIIKGELKEAKLSGVYNSSEVKFAWKCKKIPVCNDKGERIAVISHIQLGSLSSIEDVDFSSLQVSIGADNLGISKMEFKLLYLKVFYKLRASDIAKLLGVGLNTVYMYTTALREKLYLSGFRNTEDLARLERLGFFEYV
ncbi:hypothetical protein [Fangia hongkongensis]|uniref:hypothetical protein n=1 Tax=Fangia hongkongensis TaxID=270495 RepID=UPI000378FF22|nr:hypothetical protein [Fangia hongkongensis]MBK2125387.1 hypothetical protein [Fangia hongkongensis]